MINQLLKHYSDKAKLSLLIRHGNRDKIPKGTFGNEVMLNEEGIYNSRKFGESLAELPINKILTSPIGRCVQTAEYIQKGYGQSIEIIETKALGAPGLHISDEDIAGEFFIKYGSNGLYQKAIQGDEIPGIPKAEDLHQSISNFLIKQSNENGITIFVTHDMLIALYHYSINRTVYTKENWVNFLSGLILKDGKYEE